MHQRAVVTGAEAVHRAHPGQFDGAELLAALVVHGDLGAGVDQPADDQPAGGGVGQLQQRLPLGDQRAELAGLAVHQHQPAALGLEVGAHDQAALVGGDVLPLGVRGRHQLVQLVGRVVQILDPDRAGVGLRVVQDADQVAVVAVHRGPAVQPGLLRPVQQHLVGVLLGADPVQQQLGRDVGRGVDVLLVGRRIDRVDEGRGVAQPGRFDELAPRQVVGQVLAGLDIADPPGAPVRPDGLVGPGDQPAARSRHRGGEGGGAVRAGGVRVDQHPAVAGRLVGHPVDRLLLPAVVGLPEPAAALQPGHGAGGQLGELGESLGEAVPAGQLPQVVLGEIGLGPHPGGHLGGVLVLQPAVRIGDLGAVEVIALVDRAGLGVAAVRNVEMAHGLHAMRSGNQFQLPPAFLHSPGSSAKPDLALGYCEC